MTQKYRGVLNKKLPAKDDRKKLAALLRDDEETFRVLVSAEWAQKMEKIPALFEHYEIENSRNLSGMLFDLVIALAEAHVPGFQSELKRGAPVKWDSAKRRKAALALGRLSFERPGATDNALAKILHKESPWSELCKSPEALLKQVRLLNREKVESTVLARTTGLNRLAGLFNDGNK